MFNFRHSDVWKFWNKQNRIMTLAEIDLKIHPWQGNLQWQTNTHTHTLLLPLQADDVTAYDGYKSVCVLVCICVHLRCFSLWCFHKLGAAEFKDNYIYDKPAPQAMQC